MKLLSQTFRISQNFKQSFLGKKLADEQGSILLVSLMVLVVLALFGAVASNMSITELQSSANERRYNQTFYVADSAWQEPVSMLNSLGDEAPDADIDTDVVDLSALDNTPDNKIAGIPYTYNITYKSNRKIAGFGDEYRAFQYQIESTAKDPITNEDRQQLRVVLNKPFAVD